MTNESTRMYINKCKTYINFMLSQQQWSGLTKAEVTSWLNNFGELELEEQALAYKLLVHLIYYSEKDVIAVLDEGITTRLFSKILLSNQIEQNFTLSQQALNNISSTELRNTRFVPLLDREAPHESGNYVNRLLVQQSLISPTQSIFPNQIVSSFDQTPYTRLVIVDDCLGSGQQLSAFWTTSTVDVDGTSVLLSEFCMRNNIKVHYLVLFGYDKSVSRLNNELNGIDIICVRTLSDTQRVFQENSYIWSNIDELQQATKLFCELTQEATIPFLGYNNLDFAFVMHQTIPDWSLPLFWKCRDNWNLLIRRKNSND